MSKEAYVSFKTAKLLKEKGFDWEVRSLYGKYEDDIGFSSWSNNYNTYDDLYSAPTQQMACSWLRDKQIDILPDCSLVDRKYSFHIINRYKTGGEIIHSDDMYDKYEDAIEAALQYCLTNLI